MKKPTFIIKEIPRSNKKILSQLYSKIYYDQRLKQRGYKKKLNYAEENKEKNHNTESGTYFGLIQPKANQRKQISLNFSFVQ